jgi:Raf kinase inhibitor-like YbhB/YbcL family protein
MGEPAEEVPMQVKVMVTVLALCLAACSNDGTAELEETTTTQSVETTAQSTEEPEEAGMELTSPAFAHEAMIPEKYSCEGSNVSPALQIANVPTDTVTLALVMDDPDAPGGTWDHWVEFNIEPRESIPEGIAGLGTPGNNSWGTTGYGGPCPPSGTHRYFFHIYALDTELGLPEGASKADVLAAIDGHEIAHATLMGLFSF